MEIFFENKVNNNVEKSVKDLLKKGKSSNGNITLDYVPEEELECYDCCAEFIDDHYDCDFYTVSQCVAGSWDQTLTMIAVAE